MADDFLEELHAQAALGLLAADTNLVSLDGVVPNGTDPPYALLYSTALWPVDGAANALDGKAITVQATWTVHCVGLTAPAARAVQMQVREALLNQRPSIVGRVCGLIRHDQALPPTRDNTTGRVVMDAVSTFSMLSAPG
jgi:hypothetical protein